jgi:hypothetical protein
MLAAIALTAVLADCSGEPSAPVGERAPARWRHAAEPCPVTPPGGRVPATRGDFSRGNGSLAVALWPKGRLVAGRLPDGSSYAEIAADGSIGAKLGWWRGVEGQLLIEGERLDAPAPPLRADISNGYGPTGFQPTGLSFPTQGCWKVRGSVGRARLTFVVLVTDMRLRGVEPPRPLPSTGT